MKIKIHTLGDMRVAELLSDEIILADEQDGTDLIGMAIENQVQGLLLHKRNIAEPFFDLKTRLAGEVLQKFSTYGFRLTIVGDFSGYTSRSLRDFIRESNAAGRINFIGSVEEALAAGGCTESEE